MKALARSSAVVLAGVVGALCCPTARSQTPAHSFSDDSPIETLGRSLDGNLDGARGPGLMPTEANHSGGILDQLPFAFLENRGQWETPARYVARKGRVSVEVERHSLTVSVLENAEAAPTATKFTFEGASDAVRLDAEAPLPGVVNSYIGNDRTQWVQGLRRHSRIVYRGLYNGIDVQLREHAGRLEYDVLLAPGADLDEVSVSCEGVDGLEVDDDGSLVLHTAHGALRQSAPVTWAELPDGRREPLECRYVLLGERRYGFALAGRDSRLSVVIDPGLEWSTFVGGSQWQEFQALSRDSLGRILVGGHSHGNWSPPTPTGTPFSMNNGGADAFVACLDPTQTGASQLVWWTFLGGQAFDRVWDMQVNASDRVFVAGQTFDAGNSFANFPTTTMPLPAFDATHNGGWDAFVSEIDPMAGALVYSTFLGGASDDQVHRLKVAGRTVTIGGVTDSTTFPVSSSPFQATNSGGGFTDYFLTVLDLSLPAASQLQYSTYVGGTGIDGLLTERQLDFEIAASGSITLTGITNSIDIPTTPGAYQTVNAGGLSDAFVLRIDPSLSGSAALLYGTYIGGVAVDAGKSLELDASGIVTLAGFTRSDNFPTTPGAFGRTYLGPPDFNDAYVLRLDPSVSGSAALLYSTLIAGGDGHDAIQDFDVTASGTVIGVGWTGADVLLDNSLPVTCGAFQATFGGWRDGFAFALTPNGNGEDDLHYLTYIGGSFQDCLFAMEVESTAGTPVIVAAGRSESLNFPTTSGAYQPTLGTLPGADGVVLRLEMNPYLYCVANQNSVSPDGARICGEGSVVIADNNLMLSATGLPTSQFGYFLMSASQGFTPNFGGSQGNLCLGAPQFRFSQNVLNTGSSGSVAFTPDLNNLPQGVVVMPNETWYFQLWYRDNNPGTTSNTSNGLAVTFR